MYKVTSIYQGRKTNYSPIATLKEADALANKLALVMNHDNVEVSDYIPRVAKTGTTKSRAIARYFAS